MTLFTFSSTDSVEFGSFSTTDYAEAKTYAINNELAIVANEFTLADRFVIEDHRPQLKEAS